MGGFLGPAVFAGANKLGVPAKTLGSVAGTGVGAALGGAPGAGIGGGIGGAIGGQLDPQVAAMLGLPQISDPASEQGDQTQQLLSQAQQPQPDPNAQLLQLLLMLANQNRPQ